MKNNIRQFIVCSAMEIATVFAGDVCGTLEKPLVVVQPNADGSYPAQVSAVKGDTPLKEGTFSGDSRYFDLIAYGECEFLETEEALSINTAAAANFPNLFIADRQKNESVINFNTDYDNNYMGTVSLPAGIPNTWADVELQSISNFGARKNLCLGIKRFGEKGFIDVLYKTSDDDKSPDNHTSASVVLSSDSKMCFVPFVAGEDHKPLSGQVKEAGFGGTGDFSNIYRVKLGNFRSYDIRTEALNGITASNGQVALGEVEGSNALMTISDGQLFYSSDGINWKSFEKQFDGEITSIVYGLDCWIAGIKGGVAVFKNRWSKSWASDGEVSNEPVTALASNGADEVVALFGNKAYSLTHSGDFSPLKLSPIGTVNTTANITILGFSNGRWICGTEKREMFIYDGGKEDGSWTPISSQADNGGNWHGRAYNGDLYIINSNSGEINRSANRGGTWHPLTEEGVATFSTNNITLFNESLYSINGSICSFFQPASL